MTERREPNGVTRRSMLAASALASVATVKLGRHDEAPTRVASGHLDEHYRFAGRRQPGITTPAQDHLAFAAFDVTSLDRGALRRLLEHWTAAAHELMAGRPLPGSAAPWDAPADTGEAIGLGPARLTLTFGFGPSLFDHRFGLRHKRPSALIDLPRFPGDALDRGRSGGDLCVQACADDPQVAFHAVRNLARLGLGTVAMRYLQIGTGRTSSIASTQDAPRNLLGFKDGTHNLQGKPELLDRWVFCGPETDQGWMVEGSYLIARRIRTHLELWSSLTLADQQAVIGRFRHSGAPLSGRHEHDAVDLEALDANGQYVIPSSAHIRVTAPATNGGIHILRRGFNFTDGLDPVTGELDAGLYFICFQRDPLTQFVALQENVAAQDALSRYTTATSSAIFACPGGVAGTTSIGAGLFSA